LCSLFYYLDKLNLC